MRTTLNIDTLILEEVKRIQQEDGGSLGEVVIQLLSEALDRRNDLSAESTSLEWVSKPMKARVDLTDREAVYEILDGGDSPAASSEIRNDSQSAEPNSSATASASRR